MSLLSPGFLALSIAFVLLINLNSGQQWRTSICLLANFAFLASFMDSWSAALPIGGFVLLGFIAVRSVEKFRNRRLVWAWVATMVLLFAWLRTYSLVAFLPGLPGTITTVGLSYILFRILHLLYDTREGVIARRVQIADYLNFTTGFLSLVSGPIDRFQNFLANSRDHEALAPQQIREAIGRVAVGYGKVLVLSAAARYVFDNIEPQLFDPQITSHPKVIALYCTAAASYTFYLYMNFSGYMDIVIGIGRLAGLALPENFDKPFRTRNQIEFWGRWHMTLSNWFKQYAFYPILQGLMRRWPSASAAPLLGVLTYFIVFLLIGIWHGSTSIFVLYGFVLGLGVSLNKLWQLIMAARLGNKGYRKLCGQPAYEYAARGVNISYFMMALSAFWLTSDRLGELGARLGFGGWALAFLALGAGWIIVAKAADLMFPPAEARRRRRPGLHAVPAGRRAVTSFATMTAILFTCIAVQSMLNTEPEFVYANF